MTTIAEQKPPATDAAGTPSRQQLRALHTKRQENREAYHDAAEGQDVAKMRALRIEFDELAGEIKDLEAALQAEESIRADLARVQMSRAQLQARENAVRELRQTFARSEKELMATLQCLFEACVHFRNAMTARDASHACTLLGDRRFRDDYDIALGCTDSIESLLRRVVGAQVNPDQTAMDLHRADPIRWAEGSQGVAGQLLEQYRSNYRNALRLAERVLLPEPPEAA